jgi:hypothetical protein
MAESIKHLELVVALVRCAPRHLHGSEHHSILHDLPGPIGCDKPPKIGAFRPDVYAADVPTTTVVIGEAKTADDLDTEHTRRQLLDFAHFLKLYPGSSLLLAVPWSLRARAQFLLERAAREADACDLNLVVIDDASEAR